MHILVFVSSLLYFNSFISICVVFMHCIYTFIYSAFIDYWRLGLSTREHSFEWILMCVWAIIGNCKWKTYAVLTVFVHYIYTYLYTVHLLDIGD